MNKGEPLPVINEWVCLILSNSNTSQRPAPRQSHEREIRKLKGELQQETQKCKRVVEKYQQQLEEIQRVWLLILLVGLLRLLIIDFNY